MEFAIRPITYGDIPFLWDMLRYAAHLAEVGAAPPQAARDDRRLSMWVDDWGRPGDCGLIACNPSGSRKLGAAWLRLLARGSSTGYYDDETPELAIAVLPECTGHGIGSGLLSALIDSVRNTVPAVVLTVRAGNPARRLYERHGFVMIGEVPNRAGTTSSKMLLRLG
ncbi:MAG TPA: GNAT family N-acetyltransferase [Anaerolineales bacterium]